MAAIGVGIIGLGMAIKPHMLSLRDLAQRAEVIGGFSPSPARRAEFSRAWGCPAVASLDALLRQFRTENEYSRNGLPRPKYFDSKPALIPLPFPDFSTDDDRQELTIQTALVNSLLAEVQDIRARIQKAFNEQFDLLKPLGAHYRTPEVN